MSNFGDEPPLDLGCSFEEAEEAISRAFWIAFEKVRLSRVYDEVGKQLGKAAGSLIDAEADEQASIEGEGRESPKCAN